MMKAFAAMTDQEAQRHLDEHHDADMEMKFSTSPIKWDARMRRCWAEYHYWVHRTKTCSHTHQEQGVKKTKGDKDSPETKALDVEAPEKFRLDEYPGLETAVAAALEAVGAGAGAASRYVTAVKAAMDSLAQSGWKYKPAKKVRTDRKSKTELVWDELDSVMDRLMSDGEGADASDKGEAYGLALALAVMTDPYHIDVDFIRGEALTRWEARNAG